MADRLADYSAPLDGIVDASAPVNECKIHSRSTLRLHMYILGWGLHLCAWECGSVGVCGCVCMWQVQVLSAVKIAEALSHTYMQLLRLTPVFVASAVVGYCWVGWLLLPQ